MRQRLRPYVCLSVTVAIGRACVSTCTCICVCTHLFRAEITTLLQQIEQNALAARICWQTVTAKAKITTTIMNHAIPRTNCSYSLLCDFILFSYFFLMPLPHDARCPVVSVVNVLKLSTLT